MKLALSGATDANVQENTSFDFSAGDVRFVRWYFYLGKNFSMADGDKLAMFNLESTEDTTVEVAAGVDRSGENIRFWFAETNASAAQTFTLGTTRTALGRWYHAELRIDVDDGGNNGTIDGFIDDATVGSQITGLTQSVPVDAKFGAVGVDAGTSGTLLIDEIVVDDTQVYRDRERYRSANVHIVHADDHPIIGPGSFTVAVTGTGTNAVLTLYDSDGVPLRLEPLAVIRNVSANEFVPGHTVYRVNHGLYCTLSGTNVQAWIDIECACAMSDATMISRGIRQGIQRP